MLCNSDKMDDSSPNTKPIDPKDEQIITKLMRFLETYIQRRDLLQKDVHKKQNNFRSILVELEHENASLRYCNSEQKKMLKDRDRQLKRYAIDKQRTLQRCDSKMRREADRMINEMDIKLREQHKRLTSYIKKKDDKLKLMKQILMSTDESMSDAVLVAPTVASNVKTENAGESIPIMSKEEPAVVHGPLILSNSQRSSQPGDIAFHTGINLNDIQGKIAKESIPMTSKKELSSSQTDIPEELIRTTRTVSPSHSVKSALAEIATINKFKSDTKSKIPVVNPRYGRSQNVDRWINHRPVGMVPTGTIFQPQMQFHKRIIRKLTNPNNFATKSAKYCLYAQEQDTDGELETKLYKADILPTCGGGAQIVFNDIECLKQISPIAAKRCNGQTNLENSLAST
ncbi:kinesin-like protein KIF23 isoform X1 [Camponotus floridanus]|uniref:kinesin-like protein KIF23 isoform X1 n=2 Tax=Camponotus floridanus TaxID=104421 RepID=UPI000DC6CF8F|nr:kinesin-like protein KIF23 isoform X1 [Camponotus floridanus]